MLDSTPKPPHRDLAAVAVALVLPSVITWIYFFGAASAQAGIQLAVFNVVKVLQFVFPVLWATLVQRRRLSVVPRSFRGVASGVAFGALVAAATFGLYFYWFRHSAFFDGAEVEIRAKVSGFGIDVTWEYAILGLFYTLCHSFLEEYYWRWFVFGELRRWISVGPAIAVSSLGFMAHHVLLLGKYFGFDHPAAWLLSACVAIGGAVWAWMYERTGSLLGPWISHLIVDAAIFVVGYDVVRTALTGDV